MNQPSMVRSLEPTVGLGSDVEPDEAPDEATTHQQPLVTLEAHLGDLPTPALALPAPDNFVWMPPQPESSDDIVRPPPEPQPSDISVLPPPGSDQSVPQDDSARPVEPVSTQHGLPHTTVLQGLRRA